MSDIKIEITAAMVAWYGAIVATLATVFSCINFLRDRARVHIKVLKNMSMFPAKPEDKDKLYLSIRVANRGRRPISITNVWFAPFVKDAKKMLVGESVRCGAIKLQEGESTSYLLEQTEFDEAAYKYICVSDATGKEYRRRVAKAIPRDQGKQTRNLGKRLQA